MIRFLTAISFLTWPNLISLRANDSPPAPLQGAALLKTDILGVFAHPDDETGAAATLARYALGEGKVVAQVYHTRGEGGGNTVGTQWGATLGILREAELRDCLAKLGARYCYFLDNVDWAYTESLSATLRKWGKEETLGRLVRHIRSLRPDVILTMNPAPVPGQHGHHQAAAILATEAFEAAADPLRFPEQLIKEGLTVWQVRKLYFSGANGGEIATIDLSTSLPDGRNPHQAAREGMVNHRSQGFGNFGGFLPGSNPPRPQRFTLVKSMIPVTGPETNLLEGLPADESSLKRVTLGQPLPPPPAVGVRFIPRPAIQHYQQWLRDQQIDHLADTFPADLPLVSGQRNIVSVEVINHGATPVTGAIRLIAPDRWQGESRNLSVSLDPGASKTILFDCTPPADAQTDVQLTATLNADAADFATVQSTALAHPVPHRIIPLLKTPPPLDGSANGWENVPAVAIPATSLVQGHVIGDSDSSGRFRLALDGRTVYVNVDIRDDHVISNIAPTDIRAHWRSDSVELCFDPGAGAENTMGCYKLGIFPFDLTGKVRAARDADANQGPIEESAPGTRLFSTRTPDGYRIQAAIPFSELGITLSSSRRIGFNLLIYDGDNPAARPGENINKSRLAWSPRPGVNGRPEDWGRMDLE